MYLLEMVLWNGILVLGQEIDELGLGILMLKQLAGDRIWLLTIYLENAKNMGFVSV